MFNIFKKTNKTSKTNKNLHFVNLEQDKNLKHMVMLAESGDKKQIDELKRYDVQVEITRCVLDYDPVGILNATVKYIDQEDNTFVAKNKLTVVNIPDDVGYDWRDFYAKNDVDVYSVPFDEYVWQRAFMYHWYARWLNTYYFSYISNAFCYLILKEHSDIDKREALKEELLELYNTVAQEVANELNSTGTQGNIEYIETIFENSNVPPVYDNRLIDILNKYVDERNYKYNHRYWKAEMFKAKEW